MAKGVQPKCPICQQPLYMGVQHVCPAAPVVQSASSHDELKMFFWKIFASLMLGLMIQLGGAIWWASRVQSTIDQFKEQLVEQKQTIDRIDSYFRRPPPTQ